MTSKIIRTAALGAAMLAALGAQAQAQTKRAAAPAAASSAQPSAPPITHGPPITGMCLFFEQRAIATSSAGKAAADRLQQLAAQVQAELTPQQTALQNDVKTFQGQRATLTADAAQKQDAALQQRIVTFQRLADQRQQELQATQTKALRRISGELDPLVKAVYQGRSCSILINGDNAVFTANPAMDLTDQTVTQLNTRLPSITFEREHLDQAAAGSR